MYKNPILTHNFTQETAVTMYKIVTKGTSEDQVKIASASSEPLLGVADDYGLSQAINSAANKPVNVTRIGIGEVMLGGIVSRGDLLTSDAQGKAIKVTDAMVDEETIYYLGFAEQSGVENDVIPILLSPGKLSKLDAVTASASEINILDDATLTTSELNTLDLSAQTETVTSAGALSDSKKVTKIEESVGGYAVTLSVPSASMIGSTKVITMSARNAGAITMALTNVVGGSQATSASFDAAGETLVLLAVPGKWLVLKEYGVTLS